MATPRDANFRLTWPMSQPGPTQQTNIPMVASSHSIFRGSGIAASPLAEAACAL
jgi:hypothetical protein